MIKLGCGAFSVLCLLAAVVMLWLMPGFPEKLPGEAADWAVAWFGFFGNPVTAFAILALCVALSVAAASVTELLLGALLSVVAGAASLLCLLGVLGAQFPGFAKSLENFLR